MNITLHQLHIFLKVSKLKSVTKAAEEMHLTQPAISLQLKKLQEQFDIPLTEIIGRQLHLTDFGNQIAKNCENILNEIDEIKLITDDYKGIMSGHIHISVVSTGKYIIPYFIKPFLDLYPYVDITIDVSNKEKVIKDLINNESDFSLVSVVPEHLKVFSYELMDNKLYLVGRSDSELAVEKIEDLEKVPLVFREKGSATRYAMENFLKNQDIDVKKSRTLESNEAVKQALNAGLGFSIVPLIGITKYLGKNELQIYPIDGLPLVSKWNLIHSEGKKMTPVQKEFLLFLEKNKKRIIESKFDIS